ncbi:MAG TPA: class I SAM-dependent methyltransferase [Gemmatimonadaceae bacterium]|nr:class I SAM-dependent methyltransferase [Gemmatimonadaceae bacterium]
MAIEHISDTARWVAVYRAMESARPDAIFRDPFARRLAGERGEEIVERMPRGRAMAWPMIVRTAVFDEVILDAIEHDGVDTIVNLAAGLDARPWRLRLPRELRWVDVDLPAILEYKTSSLSGESTNCRYEAVAADLRDAEARRALFERIGSEGERALVVTEGLLVYLTREQVGALATDLRAVPSFRRWLIDLASPRLLEIMRKWWGRQVEQGAAPFQFAPEEGTRFFEPFGWREVTFRSTMEDAQRLHREMRMMWLWRFLGRFSSAKRREDFRRFSGTVLLEATTPLRSGALND